MLMANVEVKFGAWIEQGFNLYKSNLAVLIVGGLLALLLTSITGGILGGPMMAGLMLLCLGLLDGAQPKPTGTDVFRGFQFFLPSFLVGLLVGAVILVCYLIGLVTCVGVILIPIAVVLITTAALFAIPLVVDRRLDAVAALKGSLAIVKPNFWMFLAFGLVAGLLGSAGSILCGVGALLTFPLTTCLIAVAYRDVQAQLAQSVPAA